MEVSSKIYGTPKYKSTTICTWKLSGVVCEDFDMLYQEYIKKTKCEHCGKDFKSTKDRHLDHDHSTGLFRAVLCGKCNVWDSYIKYPNGYDKKEYGKQHYQDNKEHYKQYYEEHKEKISEQKKQKYHSNKEKISEQRKQNMVCECGEIITKINIPRHTRSFKHMNPFCDYPKTNIFT